jgi:hypothetical protein
MTIPFAEACEQLSISDIELVKWIDALDGRGFMITEIRDKLGEVYNGRVIGYEYLSISKADLKKLFYGGDQLATCRATLKGKQVGLVYYLSHFETLEIEIELFNKIKEGLGAIRKSRTIENLQLADNKYSTDLLRIIHQAINKFCLSSEYPKKDTGEVVNWLKEQKADGTQISQQLADAMETIIAPRPYAHHRQKKAKPKAAGKKNP